MSVVSFPSTLAVEKSSWGQRRNDIEFRSSFGAQAIEVSPALWQVTITAPTDFENLSGDWQAFLMKTRGKTSQIALWNLARPAPLGTCRGSMTLNAAANQGDTSLNIAVTGQNGKTLVTGDLLGIGSGLTQQVVMVVAIATANTTGIVVTTEPAIRNTITSGSTVTWDKPTALFRRQTSQSIWNYDTNVAGGFTLDLLEDTRS